MQDLEAMLLEPGGTDAILAAVAWYLQRKRGADVSILEELSEYAEAYDEQHKKKRP